MVDGHGAIVLANAEVERLFGYSRTELIGQTVEMLMPDRFRRHHPALRDDYFVNPEVRLAGRELFGGRKDGSEFSVEIALSPVETDDGLFVLAAINDITERKRLEETKEKLTKNLEESNVELQQFAYIASHDLQTPLRSIAGFAQFLQMENQDKLDEQANKHIERIVENAKRMQTLINDLLEYSRVDSRVRPFAATNLDEVFDEVTNAMIAEIEDSHGVVTRDDLPTVTGDRSQLHQLLQNLIGNGLKYHGDARPKVHVSAEKNGSEWMIAVSDNGIGIDPKHHKRIFEIFRRLHTQDAFPGTGIGLAVCQRIVQRHGGKICIESKPDEGSTFRFTIPTQKVI